MKLEVGWCNGLGDSTLHENVKIKIEKFTKIRKSSEHDHNLEGLSVLQNDRL